MIKPTAHDLRWLETVKVEDSIVSKLYLLADKATSRVYAEVVNGPNSVLFEITFDLEQWVAGRTYLELDAAKAYAVGLVLSAPDSLLQVKL